MPYIITAHIISSNPRKMETNETSTFEKLFTVLVLVSTLFTSVAGILILFENRADKHCLWGIGIAVLVLQNLGYIIAFVALIITWCATFKESNKLSGVTCIGYDVSITANTPKPTATLIAWTLMIVNAVCYVMMWLILHDQFHNNQCGNDTWNRIYNGAAIVGSFIVVLLTSFPIRKHRKKEDNHHPQNSRARTLSEYYMQTQQKQSRQNPVPN